MRRYLFLNIAAAGHVNPTLAIVHELHDRGEDVRYLLPEDWRPRVEDAGATFVPLTDAGRLERSTRHASLSPDQQIALMPYAMATQAARVVPALVSLVSTVAPDCLVVNTLDLCARLVARITGIPAVGLRPFHAPLSHATDTAATADPFSSFRAHADRTLGTFMESQGLAAMSVSALRADAENPTLVFLPRAFQVGQEAFDDRFAFVGPSLLAPRALPADVSLQERSTRAFISLGTLRNDEPDFYRLCLATFGPQWQVFMSVGTTVDVHALGPIPEHFVVRPHLPQTSLLEHVDVFVTHGGLNSVMESVRAGVPMVVLPGTREQQLTAARVAERGLGVCETLNGLTAEKLGALASAVSSDASITRELTVMQGHLRDSGGYTRAADLVMRAAALDARP